MEFGAPDSHRYIEVIIISKIIVISWYGSVPYILL